MKAAFGTREENCAYCGSFKYCRTHSNGDIMLVDGELVPDDSFCMSPKASMARKPAAAEQAGYFRQGGQGPPSRAGKVGRTGRLQAGQARQARKASGRAGRL